MLGDTQHAATKTSKHNSYAVAGALGHGWDKRGRLECAIKSRFGYVETS